MYYHSKNCSDGENIPSTSTEDTSSEENNSNIIGKRIRRENNNNGNCNFSLEKRFKESNYHA
jgi:uncharacterized protein YheU (UPF0270 family)